MLSKQGFRGGIVLKVASRVESSSHDCPRLDVRHGGLGDAVGNGNAGLTFSSAQAAVNVGVSPVYIIRTGLHPSDNAERMFSSIRLDLNVRAAQKKQLSNVVRVAYRVNKQGQGGPSWILLHAPIPKSGVNVCKNLLERVRNPDANATFFRMDFNAALSIEKASDISGERLFGKIFDCHVFIINGLVSQAARCLCMAVPVMRWIGERIEALENECAL